MKVLHLLGATGDDGGILTVIRNLATVGGGKGEEHTVWVNQGYEETRRPSLAYRRSRFLVDQCPSHLEMLFRAAPAFIELGSLVRGESFDILHAHSRGALLVALGVATLWRRPVLFTNHAYARRLGLYRWAAGRRYMTTCVLTPNMARHYGLALGPGGVRVVSACCADRFFLEPLRQDASPRSAERVLRLVGVGNIVRWKNWHLLLEAMRLLTSSERARVRFDHWGPRPTDPDSAAYAHELENLVRESSLGENCHFHGMSHSVQDALREADWFVLPSTNEACSVALIEALALGVPAVASATGGNVDIIQDGRTGLRFQPESAESLCETLQRILREAVSIAAPREIRESVRSRGATPVAGSYRSIYEEMCPSLVSPKTSGSR